jgi:hypothetical protein
VSVVISTSTNGRALQSNSWRATTDAILISELPLRDNALGHAGGRRCADHDRIADSILVVIQLW